MNKIKRGKKLCWNAIKCFLSILSLSFGRMVLVRDELRYCKQMSHKFGSLYLLNFEVMWCDVTLYLSIHAHHQTCNHLKHRHTHTHATKYDTIFQISQFFQHTKVHGLTRHIAMILSYNRTDVAIRTYEPLHLIVNNNHHMRIQQHIPLLVSLLKHQSITIFY